MKIKNITVEGFKSIYKETTFDFDKVGLWKLSGDVGAGKTTLGECILFCLFGSVKDKNIKDLISWGAKKCTSKIELESRGHNIIINRIIRQKGQGDLNILIDNKPLEYTNKRGGQQILEEDYYDVSRTAIETLCIISFNNFRSIVKISSSVMETRKFIDEVFGFAIVNSYIEKTKSHLQDSITNRDHIDSSIKTMRSQKDKYQIDRDNINTNVDLNKIEDYEGKIKALEDMQDAETMTYLSQAGLYKSLIDKTNKEMIEIKTKGKREKDVIDKLKNGICPLCGNKVNDSDIKSHQDEIEYLRTEYTGKKKKYDEYVNKYNEIVSNYKEISQHNSDQINNYKNEISKIRLQQKLLANNYDKLIEDLDKSIKEQQSNKLNAEVDVNKWQELYDKLYKESRSTLLRHYIPTLNNNINFYLQELNLPYEVTFDDFFKCTIRAFGADDIPATSLSTGQSKLVDTAVIFGILKTLLNGVNFNIFFLDELLANCHAELRDTMCKMLRDNIKDKLIYIIAHADVNSDAFKGIIKVKLQHWEEDGMLIQNSIYETK